MDVYSLTRKKRPSHLTLAQPSSSSAASLQQQLLQSSSTSAGDTDSAVDVSLTTANDSTTAINSTRSPLSYTFDEVVGSPSRDHWRPDYEADRCHYAKCSVRFGLFDRRHHCRKCGEIFCSFHCSNYFRLDQFAQFHPKGVLSRGCNTCAVEYKQWQDELRRLEKKQAMASSPSSATIRKNTKAEQQQHQQQTNSLKRGRGTRHAGIMAQQQPHGMEGVTELGRDDIVTPLKANASRGVSINSKDKTKDSAFNPIPSVPADWQWSTF
ncbi:hypothetical protein BDF20DRAFT_912721 [Mycotypha africana]|uniref:uncharacterized protein n=1 Tax=Mycotypha africana TaxID=64632 RepID=UPI002301AB7B|nr:uncharacterized protein BDF20DRAFT_912721 [Mycotypha africana]KAI8979103.1 hypothetical protein BDF20DRAFT_912721 [Mycotypha africana]